ncbi:recombinase RecT [Aliarcobacter cryaerophilus]|uniref:recombinase RecT n=1 Tax=Aliarcobacter cryaerophilus TaxID=28198 RepID=UPI003DA60B70
MSRNDLIVREQEARSIVSAKAKQISVLVGKDEAKTSKFMSALVQLSQNKNLIECKVDSIVDVGFQIVQAGLNPNPLFGQAYVVPFKLKSGFTVAQLQVGYKGYIQLGYRAGWKFKAVPVYKCDNFDYKFGGFEDDIVLEPNYEARNEDDGNWIFKNLVGVIVYAKDKDDYIVTEFVAFKKLEKLRLKSQNQVKDKLQYIWLDWAEEMYKAKALKYVVTRLPIEDDVQELISSEDNVHRIENAQSPAPREPEIQNINDINSLKNKPAQTIDVEVSAPKELAPKELITKELMNRGLTQEEAGKWCYGKSDDIFNSYLNDSASIDTILEEIRGF